MPLIVRFALLGVCLLVSRAVAANEWDLEPFPVVEQFDDFLAAGLSEAPQQGELDARRWGIESALFGGAVSASDVWSPGSQGIATIYSVEAGSSTAMAIHGRSQGGSVTFNVRVPWHISEVLVRFKALLPDARTAVTPGNVQIDFSWSLDNKKFHTERGGSATLRRGALEATAPGVTIKLPNRREERFGGVQPEGAITSRQAAAHSAGLPLFLRWTVPPQQGLVALDDIVVQDASWPDTGAVVWVSVDSEPQDEHLLREAVLTTLNRRGLPAIACDADIESEVQIKALFSRSGVTSSDASPNRASILSRAAQAGCYIPPHVPLYLARVAANTDRRSSRREAVLRLKALDKKGTDLSGSAAEPDGVHWTWATLVDKVVKKALNQEMPPDSSPPAIETDHWTSLEFRTNEGNQHIELLQCDEPESCADLVHQFETFRLCQAEADMGCKPPGTPPRVLWAATLTGAIDGRAQLSVEHDAETVVHHSDDGRASVRLTDPGEYVLLTSWDQRSWTARSIHVSTLQNLLRLSGGVARTPGLVGELSYTRLIGPSSHAAFGAGITAIGDAASDRVTLALTALARLMPAGRIAGLLFSSDLALMGGVALPTPDQDRPRPAVALSLGINWYPHLFLSWRASRAVDGGPGAAVSFGPRLLIKALLDNPRETTVVPMLQSGLDW